MKLGSLGILILLSAAALPAADSSPVRPPVAPAVTPPRRPKDGPEGPFEPAAARAVLLASVHPLNRQRLRPSEEPRSRRLMQAYEGVVVSWARLLAKHAVPVPAQTEWLRYDSGGARQGCYAALIFAFVATASDAPESSVFRIAARQRAIGGLRYLAQGHVAGGGVYLGEAGNGGAVTAWGGRWQSALYAHAMGLAGWLLWDELDDDTRVAVSRVVEYEADRFLHQPPPGSLARDTKAEENAWNAMLIALAANMLSRHPRAERWRVTAQAYMYNTFSVAADRMDDSPGDGGRAVRDWVTTVNVHPDFTLENHGLAHVGYMKTTLAELLSCAIPYALAEQPVPRAARHHVSDVFAALLRFMAWDGAPVYCGGNDWALFHQQAADSVVFSLVSLLEGDGRAAAVEDIAVDYLQRQQRVQGGYVDVRHDLTYTSQCCVRLIHAWLGHALFGARAPAALSPAELERALAGVTVFPEGRVIIHRTATKFASFAWGSQRLALALPRDGNWVIWPHFSSYLGEIDGAGPAERNAPLRRFRHHARADGFEVSGSLERGGVTQDFAFVSLPDDLTLYVERLRPVAGGALRSRETGIVGHAYALGENERRLFAADGAMTVRGGGGGARVHEIAGSWLNIDDRVGYVVVREPGRENLIRYHDLDRGPRWPDEPQEWISLVGERTALPGGRDDCAAVITFLNQTSAATRASAGRATLMVEGNIATCRIERASIRMDFDKGEIQVLAGR